MFWPVMGPCAASIAPWVYTGAFQYCFTTGTQLHVKAYICMRILVGVRPNMCACGVCFVACNVATYAYCTCFQAQRGPMDMLQKHKLQL